MIEVKVGAVVGQGERGQRQPCAMTADAFKKEVYAWAKEIGVKPKEIHLRSMKRKLASCSSKGRLTFDVSLLGESKDVRDEAVLHELLHLKYPNHGKMFKMLLSAHLAEQYPR